MAVSDLFVLLVNNNLCIIGAKIIVISLSLAVEDGWEGMDCEVCHLCFVPAKMKVQEMRGQTIDSMENESRLNFLHIYIYNTRSNLPPDQKRRRRIPCNNWHRCCAVH